MKESKSLFLRWCGKVITAMSEWYVRTLRLGALADVKASLEQVGLALAHLPVVTLVARADTRGVVALAAARALAADLGTTDDVRVIGRRGRRLQRVATGRALPQRAVVSAEAVVTVARLRAVRVPRVFVRDTLGVRHGYTSGDLVIRACAVHVTVRQADAVAAAIGRALHALAGVALVLIEALALARLAVTEARTRAFDFAFVGLVGAKRFVRPRNATRARAVRAVRTGPSVVAFLVVVRTAEMPARHQRGGVLAASLGVAKARVDGREPWCGAAGAGTVATARVGTTGVHRHDQKESNPENKKSTTHGFT